MLKKSLKVVLLVGAMIQRLKQEEEVGVILEEVIQLVVIEEIETMIEEEEEEEEERKEDVSIVAKKDICRENVPNQRKKEAEEVEVEDQERVDVSNAAKMDIWPKIALKKVVIIGAEHPEVAEFVIRKTILQKIVQTKKNEDQ